MESWSQMKIKISSIYLNINADLCGQAYSKLTDFMMHCFTSQVLSLNEEFSTIRMAETGKLKNKSDPLSGSENARNSLMPFLIQIKLVHSFLKIPLHIVGCMLCFTCLFLYINSISAH